MSPLQQIFVFRLTVHHTLFWQIGLYLGEI